MALSNDMEAFGDALGDAENAIDAGRAALLDNADKLAEFARTSADNTVVEALKALEIAKADVYGRAVTLAANGQ